MRGGLARETGRWAGSGGAHGGLASGEALWRTQDAVPPLRRLSNLRGAPPSEGEKQVPGCNSNILYAKARQLLHSVG